MAIDIVNYKEKYRPQYHFTPVKNWMNDPNGMVYYQGEYHLFYQHHPESNVWGPMHWGHAVSKDMLHWQHLPIALEPDQNGAIFSGSAVVDKNDSSGFFDGGEGLVAIFTHADNYPDSDRPRQRQSIAYSKDKGRSWQMYEGNPVLVDENYTDFRDPKVYWFEEFQKWIMVLVAGDHARFYSSKNLKDWDYLSSFTGGTTAGVWECPDLFKIAVEGSDEFKWILEIDINPGGPQGGSGAQYFVGEFDGTNFINDNSHDKVLWLDYGKDYYAGVSWDNIPEEDGRRLWLAWMSNWQYANKVPTSTWRSAMTIPRSLKLKKDSKGYTLLQTPVEELKQIRKAAVSWKDIIIDEGKNILKEIKGKCLEIKAEFEIMDAREFGFKVRKGENEETRVAYNVLKEEVFIDRRDSGEVDFQQDFAGVHQALIKPEENCLQMHIFVDWSSLELFVNDGEISITDLIFPDPESEGLELYTKEGKVKIKSLEVYKLKSVWGN